MRTLIIILLCSLLSGFTYVHKDKEFLDKMNKHRCLVATDATILKCRDACNERCVIQHEVNHYNDTIDTCICGPISSEEQLRHRERIRWGVGKCKCDWPVLSKYCMVICGRTK